MKTQAIVPAAGVGKRFKSSTPKIFISLHGKPVVYYSLNTLERCAAVDSIILVGNKRYLKELRGVVERFRFRKIKKIVSGGARRADSVRAGLAQLDHNTTIVLVHDAARPLVTQKNILDSIKTAGRFGAAVVAVPVKPTIKVVNPKTKWVERTLDRKVLWEIQTPQTFKRPLLEKAHKKFESKEATDDAILVEALGIRVKVVLGEYSNIKITTQDDLVVARAILGTRKRYATLP